jgi:hypothetical protein
MCMSSTPVASPTVSKPQYMHNSYLDGINEGEGLTIGRNSLRIDLNNSPNNLSVPSAPQNNPSGQGLVTPRNQSQVPQAVSAAPAGTAPGGMSAAALTPGMVIPTVGGALAGALPPNVTISGAGAAK